VGHCSVTPDVNPAKKVGFFHLLCQQHSCLPGFRRLRPVSTYWMLWGVSWYLKGRSQMQGVLHTWQLL